MTIPQLVLQQGPGSASAVSGELMPNKEKNDMRCESLANNFCPSISQPWRGDRLSIIFDEARELLCKAADPLQIAPISYPRAVDNRVSM